MGMFILPLKDENGNDVLMLWGQLLRDATVKNLKSKKTGNDFRKTNLFVRHGQGENEVIAVDLWYALADVCAGAKKGDFFFGIGTIEQNNYNNQTSLVFTTGSGSMRYAYAAISRKPKQKSNEAEPFKEANLPTDVFADIKQHELPF